MCRAVGEPWLCVRGRCVCVCEICVCVSCAWLCVLCTRDSYFGQLWGHKVSNCWLLCIFLFVYICYLFWLLFGLIFLINYGDMWFQIVGAFAYCIFVGVCIYIIYFKCVGAVWELCVSCAWLCEL